MAAFHEEQGIGYSFEWKIENFSYIWHKTGEKIVSPAFVIDRFENTKWTLNLYPRGDKNENYIGFYLKRKDVRGSKDIEIQCELQFLTEDGMVLRGYRDRKAIFGKDMARGYEEFIKRQTVFFDEKETYLANDTLTALCIIKSNHKRVKLIKKFFARTIIKVNRTSFYWNIGRFRNLEGDRKISHDIRSLKNKDLLTCNFYMSGEQFSPKSANVSISVHDKKIKFLILKVFLVDISGEKVKCGQQFYFNGFSKHVTLLLPFTKKFIIENRNKYLKDGDLRLQCECAYSTGFAFEATETIDFGIISSENSNKAFENVYNNLEQPNFFDTKFLNEVFITIVFLISIIGYLCQL
ncbi:hypothetical protein AVEN_237303-1 [Araneus ventricosus]|uniref:MATH domain-containing protein n=1 Tax=Araneus ventricosus TaxID=182803 RepID=A0A4Y2DKJ7_ARAVE|nr:hypothetical protein AVEN_237303-1 [Araneus ventricosus]